MNNVSESDKLDIAKQVPWTDEAIKEAMSSVLKSPGNEFISQASAFACGVRCREASLWSVKPFPAPGAWFPTDILGNPMREVKPGSWEVLTTLTSSSIRCIVVAYEQGVGQGDRENIFNPYAINTLEYKAWDLGREFVKNRHHPGPSLGKSDTHCDHHPV